MKSHTGVPAKCLKPSPAKESHRNDLDREIKVSVIVELSKGEQALRAVTTPF